MRIAAIQGSSLLDFPGHLACIVFTQGCPYDCFYCHNRALVPFDQGGDMVDLAGFLGARVGLLDGVVITGGEPTVQPGLEESLAMIRALGFATKLDTNGCNPERIEGLLQAQLVDYLALDVKAVPHAYPSVCGPNARWEEVNKTLGLLKASSIKWEVRTTVYPGLGSEALLAIAACIGAAPLWRLNTYRVPSVYKIEDTLRVKSRALTALELDQWIDAHRPLIQAKEVTT